MTTPFWYIEGILPSTNIQLFFNGCKFRYFDDAYGTDESFRMVSTWFESLIKSFYYFMENEILTGTEYTPRLSLSVGGKKFMCVHMYSSLPECTSHDLFVSMGKTQVR